MAEMLLLDTLKGFRTVIHQEHLLYLELDESPKKLDQREKLENYIKQYLYVAPHNSKFMYQQTAEVLRRSASTKTNFSAYKAAVAWKAIGKYADNLILHPWRQEYRNIKLYCGFFKHEVEENLAGAELMLEAMGYRHAGQSHMTLPGILDPDRITNVSKDAIVAYVECQIMKQIWETLTPNFNITWLEILDFRQNHTGTAEQVIRALNFRYHIRHFQDQSYPRHQSECPVPECFYGPGCYNHGSYPGPSYSMPIQSRYGHMLATSPIYPSNVHPSYPGPNMLKPQDIYPVNGYAMHHHYSSPYSVPHMPHNGYSGVPMMYSQPSVVPTGQLIELDSSPTHNKGDEYFQNRSTKYPPHQDSFYHHEDALKDDGPSLTGKAKDDGAGSWENWDLVYRILESQGYAKDSDSQGRIPQKDNRSYSSQNNSSDELDSLVQTDISDKMRKMKLSSKGETSSSKSIGEVDEGNVRNLKTKSKTDQEKAKPKPSKSSPEKQKKPAASAKTTKSEAKDSSVKKSKDDKPLTVNLNESNEDKWQCITCTYLNSNSSKVCEMCFKSKKRGSEVNPQPTGGQECPKCTLVNEPGLSRCAACSNSLKDSPTYI